MTNPADDKPKLLVTGAAGGMGRAAAILAAMEGTSLILADLDSERLNALAAECIDLGAPAAQPCVLDVTDGEAVAALLDTLPSEPSLGGIIHTVGLSPQMADWRRIVDVDLVGSVSLLEQLRPHLCPGAAAVAIASMSAYLCPPDEVVDTLLDDPLHTEFDAQLTQAVVQQPLLKDSGMAYAWSKAALTRWVTRAASTWGKEGKRLVSVSPGLIDTDMGRLENNSMGEEQLSAMKQRIALERLGTADDIAQTALFLASAKAAYITGCDILVDGGFVASVQATTREGQGVD